MIGPAARPRLVVTATYHDKRSKIAVVLRRPGDPTLIFGVDRVEWSDDERPYMTQVGETRHFELPPETPVVVPLGAPARLLIGAERIARSIP